MPKPQLDGRQRAIIETVSPEIDGGRFAAKRTIGDIVRVEADIFTDGHDSVAAAIRYWQADSEQLAGKPMLFVDNDRWAGSFPVTNLGRARFTILAWVDHWETWRRDLAKRVQAHNDSTVDYLIGANLLEEARASAAAPTRLGSCQSKELRAETNNEARRAAAIDACLNDMHAALSGSALRHASTSAFSKLWSIPCVRASAPGTNCFRVPPAPIPAKHGTFADCEARLPYVAELGFDVLYLPPIHPIGLTFRKGKNNVVEARTRRCRQPLGDWR